MSKPSFQIESQFVEKYFSEPKTTSAVYIHGKKYLMDATGKPMLQVPQGLTESASNESSMKNVPLKRIDISGGTFVQEPVDVLIRTNAHNARSPMR
jgi:hypothetical protein